MRRRKPVPVLIKDERHTEYKTWVTTGIAEWAGCAVVAHTREWDGGQREIDRWVIDENAHPADRYRPAAPDVTGGRAYVENEVRRRCSLWTDRENEKRRRNEATYHRHP